MVYHLTIEQEQAIQCFLRRESLKIEALAGAGKTSTLVQMAAAAPSLQGSYLAFNNAIAAEAAIKFGENTICRTTHKMAFECLSGELGYSSEKLLRNPNSIFFESLLKHETYELPVSTKLDGSLIASRRNMGILLRRTIQQFCQSADRSPGWTHVPKEVGRFNVTDADRREIWQIYGRKIEAIWQRMEDDRSAFPLGHDGYLKLFALLDPVIEGDYIMADEVQDTSDVVLDLLSKQQMPVVYVGDSHQQLYQWRGAVDALKKLDISNCCSLSTSFRFGERIASLAGGVITRLGSMLKLRGFRTEDCVINDEVETRAILCRYNRTAFEEASKAMARGKKVHVIGGTEDFRKLNDEIDRLDATGISDHADLFGFQSLRQLEDYCSNYQDSAGMVGTILRMRKEVCLGTLLRSIVDEDVADVTISTVHRAKGKEWASVLLNDDLCSAGRSVDSKSAQEADRIRYVAATRAQKVLSLSTELQEQY